MIVKKLFLISLLCDLQVNKVFFFFIFNFFIIFYCEDNHIRFIIIFFDLFVALAIKFECVFYNFVILIVLETIKNAMNCWYQKNG